MMNLSQAIPTSKRVEQALLQYVQWIRTHQEQFWSIFGTLSAALLLVFFMMTTLSMVKMHGMGLSMPKDGR